MHRPANQTEQNVRDREAESVDAFLELDADGNVTVYSGKVELGTGVATALMQVVAGEMGVPLDHVRIVMGDTALTPDQGTTAGSKTIQIAGLVLRRAASEARRSLLERAAERLELPGDDLWIEEGLVRSTSEPSLAIPIGDLAGEPFGGVVPAEVPELPPASGPFVGMSAPRVDLLAKLTGGAAFVQDIRLEGMLHGRVVRPWVRTMDGIGTEVAEVDDGAVRRMPGVVAIVRNGSFLGVVAEREEQAIRAAEALRVTWADRSDLPSPDDYRERMRELPSEDVVIDQGGDVDAALGTADRMLTATYTFPYQAHASMGPSCAVADVRDDRALIYTSTQGVYGLRKALAPLLDMDEERIRLIFREGAGCYGHNGADDVTADAALLSQAVGRPVRLQWSRQGELAWEPKSPAMVIEMTAGLDSSGGIIAWEHAVWTPTHVARPNGQPGNLLAGQQVDPPMPAAPLRFGGGDRNAPTTYTFPSERVTMHWLGEAPLRPSAMRSLGGLNNTTANETFLDEIAIVTGVDPVALRLRYLDDPRAIEVIRTAAERAGWGEPVDVTSGLRAGRGFAYAQYETEYAYVATVAEVEVDPGTGEVRVRRIVVAHDCGRIINPDGVANQVEGNVIQGVSRALKERVTWDEHEVTSLTWETYPILTFPEVPEIEVALIDRRGEPSLGAGEPAICTVTAAIGNAIFDATGVRLRDIPFTPDRVREATGER
ncbi:MAG TPA: molybdopterin cofactor-binding domain-containing protein [Thermomicrobiales bacterium]|nr:molybdopterin cofactor-binding domain-containing protein [Thermomicrobiales bacterium]